VEAQQEQVKAILSRLSSSYVAHTSVLSTFVLKDFVSTTPLVCQLHEDTLILSSAIRPYINFLAIFHKVEESFAFRNYDVRTMIIAMFYSYT